MEVKPKETRQTAVRLAGCVSFFNFNVFPGTTPIYHKSDLLICVSHASKLKFYKELNLRELRRMLQRAFSKCSAVFLKAVFFCRLWWEKKHSSHHVPCSGHSACVRVCDLSVGLFSPNTLDIFSHSKLCCNMNPCMQKYTTGGQKAYSCHKLLTPPSQRQHLLTISMHLISSSCEEETGLRQSSAEKH